MKFTKIIRPITPNNNLIEVFSKRAISTGEDLNIDNFFTLNIINFFQPDIIAKIIENIGSKNIILNIEIYKMDALNINDNFHISKISRLFSYKIPDLNHFDGPKFTDQIPFDSLYCDVQSSNLKIEQYEKIASLFEIKTMKNIRINLKNNFQAFALMKILIKKIQTINCLTINFKNTHYNNSNLSEFLSFLSEFNDLSRIKLDFSKNYNLFQFEKVTSFTSSIKNNEKLQKISLKFKETPCSIITICSLSYFLIHNISTLKSLNLNFNKTNFLDDYLYILSKTFAKLEGLQTFKLCVINNYVQNRGIIQLAEAFISLGSLEKLVLNINSNNFDASACLVLLTNLNYLKKLKFLSLKLGKNNLDNSCVMKLSEFILNQTKLKVLKIDLSQFKMNPIGLKQLLLSLKMLKRLKYLSLNLFENEFLDEEESSVQDKEKIKNIKNDPTIIAESYENENNNHSNSNSDEDKSSKSIESIKEKRISKKSVKHKISHLKNVEFKESKEKINKTLKKQMISEDIKQHLSTYRIYKNLQDLHLNLSNTKFDIHGIGILSKIFEYNFFQNLKKLELILANNKFTSYNCEELFAEFENLNNLKYLTLNLKHNRLQNKGCIHLAETFGKMTNLTYLNLNLKNNNLSKDGFSALFTSVSEIPNLSFLKLNLSRNYISKEAVECLPRTLQNLSALKYFILYLHYNVLEPEGLATLSRSLSKINPELTHLDLNLCFNSSEEYDFKKIIMNIMNFTNLKYFSLNLNGQKMGNFNEFRILKDFFDRILKNAKVFIMNLSKSDVKNEFFNMFILSLSSRPSKIRKILLNLSFTSVNLDYKFLESLKITPLGNLKSLSLDFSGNFEKNSKFSLESISKILDQTKFLEKLELVLKGNTFSNESFFLFSLELSNLKYLRVLILDFSTSNITYEFILKISKSFEKFTNLNEFSLDLEGNEIRDLKSLEKLLMSLKNSCFTLSKLKIILMNTFLNYDEQALVNGLNMLNDLKFIRILYLDLGMNKLYLDKIFEILKKNLLNLPNLQEFYLNLDLNPMGEYQVLTKNDEIYKIIKENSFFLKYININLNLNEVFLNNRTNEEPGNNTFLGIYPQLNKMRRQTMINNQKRDSIEMSSKRRVTVLHKINMTESSSSEMESLTNINYRSGEKKPKEFDVFKTNSMNGKRGFKKFIRKHFFLGKKVVYPPKNLFLKIVYSKIKGIALQFSHIKKPKVEELFETIKILKGFKCFSLDVLSLKFNNIICPEIFEMDLSFLNNFSTKIFTQFSIDFPPDYDHRIWAKLSILNHFDHFQFSILNINISSFNHGRINHFYFTEIFKNSFFYAQIILNKKMKARTSSIHLLDEKKSLKSYIVQYTDIILSKTPLVSFDFDSFFERSSHLFTLNTLRSLSNNTLLFCKFKASHMSKLASLFRPEDSETSKTINNIFRNALKSILQIDLIAYILTHNSVSQFLNIKSFEMLVNFLKKLKQNKNVLIWKIAKQKIIEINLENNLNICTRTCQEALLSLLDNYWKSYKLETPSDGSELKMHKFENEINKFYSGLRIHIKSYSFQHLDDSYQEILISLLEILPNIKKINISHLNLNDYFCEKFSDLLLKGLFLKLEYLNISHNPRITNVGLKYLAVGLGFHRENKKTYKKNCDKNIVVHIKKSFNNIETILLDQGLERAIQNRFANYFKRNTFFCYSCLKQVCSNCHSANVENLLHDCKTRRKFETNFDPFCILNQNQRESEWYRNIIKDPFFIFIMFYYVISLPINFTYWMVKMFGNFFKKIRKTKGFQSPRASKRKIHPSKEGQQSISFFSFWTNNYQLEDIDKNSFKCNKRVLTVEEFLRSGWLLVIITTLQIINYLVCILNPFLLHDMVFHVFESDLSVSHLFIVGNCVLCFCFEYFLSYIIIKKLNYGSNEFLIKEFNYKNYGFYFSQTLAYKIGFYLDSYFVIVIIKSNGDEANFNQEINQIYMFTALLFGIHIIINLLMGILCLKQAIKYHSVSVADLKITGIASLMINFYTRLAVLNDFQCLAKILDTFSTKSAIKLKSIYVSQIVISSLLKFLLEDMTLMVSQIYFSYETQISNRYILYMIIMFKIITFYSSFFTAMNAKASHFSREDLERLFRPVSKKDIVDSEIEMVQSEIVKNQSDILLVKRNLTNKFPNSINLQKINTKTKRRDIQQLREINHLQNNIKNAYSKRGSTRISKKWAANSEFLWLEENGKIFETVQNNAFNGKKKVSYERKNE